MRPPMFVWGQKALEVLNSAKPETFIYKHICSVDLEYHIKWRQIT